MLSSTSPLRAARPVGIWRQRRISRRCVRVTSSGEMLPSRSYNSGDGKPKTTLEEVFTKDSAVTPRSVSAPWEFSWQMNERNVQWKASLDIRFKIGFVAEKLEIETEECERRVRTLADVIPGFEDRLPQMSTDVIAELVQQIDTVADTLLQLKTIFPQANVGSLVVAQPSLASMESLEEVAAVGQELRALLPNSNVDALVEQFPMLLDLAQLKESMKLLEVLMPGNSFEETLQNNPQLIFSLQKGKNMIPYDEVPTSKT